MVTAFILLLASPTELSCAAGGRQQLSLTAASSRLELRGELVFASSPALVGWELNTSPLRTLL